MAPVPRIAIHLKQAPEGPPPAMARCSTGRGAVGKSILECFSKNWRVKDVSKDVFLYDKFNNDATQSEVIEHLEEYLESGIRKGWATYIHLCGLLVRSFENTPVSQSSGCAAATDIVY